MLIKKYVHLLNNSNIHDRMRFQRPFVVQICLYNLAVACLIFDFQSFFLNPVNKKDIRLDLLRKLEVNPGYTQRELSQEMGVSLGKINYCMKKLIEKGLVKLSNFSHNPNKVNYIYLLTPKGIEQKARLTVTFLAIKLEEYEMLKNEISKLKQDAEELQSGQK